MSQKFSFKDFYHCIILMPNELSIQDKRFISSLLLLLKISPGCFSFCLSVCISIPYYNSKFVIPSEPIMFPFMSAHPAFFI